MPNTYDNLAEVYLFQGRYKQGIEMINKAIELRPNDYRFSATLADLYGSIPEMAGKSSEAYRKAIELAERQLALDQTNGEVLSDVAVYQAKTGNIKQALEQIERSRSLTPDNKDVVQNAVIVYEVAGRRDRALMVLEEAVKQNYPLDDVLREQALSGLRKDPRYQRIIRGATLGVPIQ
jgi:tetratricopeptide (TPR) repeat protein